MASIQLPSAARCIRSTTRHIHLTQQTRRAGHLSHIRPAPSLRHQTRSSSTDSDTPSLDATVSPKISTIVEQISTLTLLETADLVSTLRSRLNIPIMSALPGGSPTSSPSEAPKPAEEAEEDDAGSAKDNAAAKTLFTLHLKAFDPASKPKLIKEIKALLGLSLVESKKFVESAPKMMRENVPKEEGEKIKTTLEGVGGTVAME